MMTLFKRLFFSTIILFIASQPLQAAAETFIFDDQHSYLLWRVKHLGFSTQSGKWYAKGEVRLDKEHPENSAVEATIDVANIITGIPELDKHLKSADFFDVEKYPTASFKSNKVELSGKNSAKVSGMLTLHGVTKPLTLTVTLNKVGIHPMNNKNTVGFSATTTIKRSDFGINKAIPAVSDEVIIDIDAEANLKS